MDFFFIFSFLRCDKNYNNYNSNYKKKQLGFRNPQEKLEKMVSDLESPNLAIFKDSINFKPVIPSD